MTFSLLASSGKDTGAKAPKSYQFWRSAALTLRETGSRSKGVSSCQRPAQKITELVVKRVLTNENNSRLFHQRVSIRLRPGRSGNFS